MKIVHQNGIFQKMVETKCRLRGHTMISPSKVSKNIPKRNQKWFYKWIRWVWPYIICIFRNWFFGFPHIRHPTCKLHIVCVCKLVCSVANMGKSQKSISKNTYDIRPNSSKSSIKSFLTAFMYVLAKFRWGNRPSKNKISFSRFLQNVIFWCGRSSFAGICVCVCVYKLTGGWRPPERDFHQKC